MFSNLRKLMLGVAAVLLLGTLFTGSASAFTNAGVGDPVFGRDDGNGIDLGTLINCSSSLKGEITRDDGPGNGGAGELTGGDPTNTDDFTSCTSPTGTISAQGTYTTPWEIEVAPNGEAEIRDINVLITGATFTCRYEGQIDGNYNDSTGEGALSGDLTRTDESGLWFFFCGDTEPVNGTYLISLTSGGTDWLVL